MFILDITIMLTDTNKATQQIKSVLKSVSKNVCFDIMKLLVFKYESIAFLNNNNSTNFSIGKGYFSVDVNKSLLKDEEEDKNKLLFKYYKKFIIKRSKQKRGFEISEYLNSGTHIKIFENNFKLLIDSIIYVIKEENKVIQKTDGSMNLDRDTKRLKGLVLKRFYEGCS